MQSLFYTYAPVWLLLAGKLLSRLLTTQKGAITLKFKWYTTKNDKKLGIGNRY